MRATTIRYAVTALIAAGILAGLAGPSHAQFTLYDNFVTGTIDPGLWQGTTTEGTLAAPVTEFIRSAETGSLQLGLTSWGNDTSNSSSTVSRIGVQFKQLGTFGLDSIIGIKVKVTVLDAAVASDCAVNPDPSTNHRSRTQIIGWFFNDGSGPGGADDTGNVFASIQLTKEADGSNKVQVFMGKCTNATCSTSIVPAGVTTPTLTTTWTVNTPLILKMRWDRANGKFKFLVKDPATQASETAVIDYLGFVSDNGAPTNFDLKALRTQNNVKNCSGDRKQVMMNALFDNVNVQREVH
jgi:hypothetical protein